ncbi:MAG: glycosyltransferase family 2 protein [Actinomycetota bacterium]|nr:glycosyltransferase family 2 protein [Actinomycetota bacterium]MEC9088294.1 glycosyltransferase family 2 protein [Actinomycetota bacterium]
MRLVIQIPCLNEAETLPTTLEDLPRAVKGFDDVLWVVIDDGSTDRTAEVAKAHGADMVVQLANNKGLAVAFQAGLDASLQLGADVIVNTDADNQYAASDIPRLVEPICNGEADLVVGTRDIANHEEFSPLKKWLQRIGSWVVRQASATHVSDVTSGFRAYSKEAALQVNVVSQFTYTLESLIQAGRSNLKVADVPIGVNPTTRTSRLFRSKRQYVRRSAGTISRVYAMHKPLRFFNIPAAAFAAVGLILFGRFGWYYLSAGGEGRIQSLIVGAVCLLVSVQMLMLGLLADLLRTNRVITERVLRRVRNIELSLGTYGNTEEESDSDF